MMVNAIMRSFDGLELDVEQEEQRRTAPLFTRPRELEEQMKTQGNAGDGMTVARDLVSTSGRL